MSELRDLYQDVILDHNRHPRNFGKPQGANREAEGYNPLCGDRIKIYLRVERGAIAEVAFEGSGCAISQACASLMTEAVKGKTIAQAEQLADSFHRMVTAEGRHAELGKLEVLAGVREFPARIKCATLPWHTLNAALKGRDQPVTTEE